MSARPSTGEAAAAIAHDYATLMGALIERKRRLGLTNLDVEARGGFPTGYADKLFNGARKPGLILLGRLLDALEVRILVVPERALGLAKLGGIATPINRLNESGKDLRRAEWGRAGGIKRRCLLTPARRRAIAKLGGLACAAKARARAEAEAERLAVQAAPAAPLRALERAKAKGRSGADMESRPVRICTPIVARTGRDIGPVALR